MKCQGTQIYCWGIETGYFKFSLYGLGLRCSAFSLLLFFLSKKVSKKGHRRRLHPGGGGFPD